MSSIKSRGNGIVFFEYQRGELKHVLSAWGWNALAGLAFALSLAALVGVYVFRARFGW